ncbi:kinase [Kroppenstedtia eburnea]|uniref:Threonine kinase n=1 Tax=Kroppenstedtia eburnea TaxID=714067 RepID=A0A1N7LY14_9BACL|nr:kinase [Kroppenstedtia eburnea]EGK06768.1 GHMP kinase domain protein [Desmospora sp. 8437]QKI81707.1 kinase [Kroppenstedtia eburnea]SIS78720.1 threonine kinase [Kroppenstedtia eburnea]
MQEGWKTDSTAVRGRFGTGTAFGTFGELLQGVHADNDLDFLVTFPIDRGSRAILRPDSSSELTVVPPFKQKSVQLAARLLDHFGLPCRGSLMIESDLPIGKGLASSSADLLATARAIESCYGINIPISLLQRFMAEIEPTDGVMYPGVVSFFHRKVELGEIFGPMPRMTVVAVDEGGEVDTIDYNRFRKPYTAEEKLEYTQLMSRLKIAFQEQDVYTIGQVATRSTMMNQSRQEKRSLKHLLQLSHEQAALGIVNAHSGTFIGLLFWKEDRNYERKLAETIKQMKQTYVNVYVYHSL